MTGAQYVVRDYARRLDLGEGPWPSPRLHPLMTTARPSAMAVPGLPAVPAPEGSEVKIHLLYWRFPWGAFPLLYAGPPLRALFPVRAGLLSPFSFLPPELWARCPR
jgi:hypothetical protein